MSDDIFEQWEALMPLWPPRPGLTRAETLAALDHAIQMAEIQLGRARSLRASIIGSMEDYQGD